MASKREPRYPHVWSVRLDDDQYEFVQEMPDMADRVRDFIDHCIKAEEGKRRLAEGGGVEYVTRGSDARPYYRVGPVEGGEPGDF